MISLVHSRTLSRARPIRPASAPEIMETEMGNLFIESREHSNQRAEPRESHFYGAQPIGSSRGNEAQKGCSWYELMRELPAQCANSTLPLTQELAPVHNR